jgi:ferredoxin-nitrite reductase
MYELPRKFNVCFDNGGVISVAADTNDIGFVPVQVDDKADIEPDIYFRVLLAGITGHGRFAQDAGILVRPVDAVSVAIAMIRVFIENGSRTNRKKARLAHLIEKWGIVKFLEETEKKLSFPILRVPLENTPLKNQKVRHGHVGVYKQKQPGLSYVGIAIPIGRMKAKQMLRLADIAEKYGSGDLRLTVWQNIIIPDIPYKKISLVQSEIKTTGFNTETNFVTGGIISCTGKSGCNFAAADTKKNALTTSARLEGRVTLDRAINIHFTGCPNSCAQHYIGDIGVMAVPVGESAESYAEGYNIALGGGFDYEQGLAREIFWKVSSESLPLLIEKILKTYNMKRKKGESFSEFIRRHEIKTLQEIFERGNL